MGGQWYRECPLIWYTIASMIPNLLMQLGINNHANGTRSKILHFNPIRVLN